MEKNEIIYKFIEIYENHIDYKSIEYDGRNFLFQLAREDFDSNLIVIKSIFNEVDTLLENKISLKINNLKIENFLVFFKREDFLKKFKNYLDNFDDSCLLILEENGKVLFKSSKEVFLQEKAIFFNNFSYQNILGLLKSNSQFCSIKSTENEIIIVSKENSIMHIGYKNFDTRLSDVEDLLPHFLLLKKRFEKIDFSDQITDNTEFIKLFIETISTAGIGNYKKQDRFFEIVKGIKIIISLTERDYDNYISNFSFEKIKAKFKEERNKYFESLEKNIDLISKQVVSFPLTFAATAFASYQVKDRPLILILIFVGYFLYTLIAIRILGIASFNIDCLEDDITKEENSIKDNYRKTHSEFEEDFKKIGSKTKKIKDLITYLRVILFSMLILFFLYSIYQIFYVSEKRVDSVLIPQDRIQFVIVDSLKNNNLKSEKDVYEIKKVIKIKDTANLIIKR